MVLAKRGREGVDAVATSRKEMVTFEFADNGAIVGRATWLGPGMIELDFSDARTRRTFERCLAAPQHNHGPVFEVSQLDRLWPDESKAHFAEACMSMSNLYRVRRLH